MSDAKLSILSAHLRPTPDADCASSPAQNQSGGETAYAEIDAPHWIEIAAELSHQSPTGDARKGFPPLLELMDTLS
jgi:hypothetical protein